MDAYNSSTLQLYKIDSYQLVLLFMYKTKITLALWLQVEWFWSHFSMHSVSNHVDCQNILIKCMK